MMRIDEPGWIEIGKRCSADRRSTWVRLNYRESAWRGEGDDRWALAKAENVESVEWCAGREGDDAYVKVDHSNPQFAALLELALTALYAVET